MPITIFIDAGHGGKDSGAVGNGLYESRVNLAVALRLRDRLTKLGFKVVMSRTTDVFLELGEICRLANASGASYFISVHHNAGGGKGFEVIRALSGGKSLALATKVANCFAEIGQIPHGANPVYAKAGQSGSDYFAVIRGTKMPAIITEFGFIDNNVDVAKFNTLAKQQAEAEALCKAICIQAGVKYVTQVTNTGNTSNKVGSVTATALNVRNKAVTGIVLGTLKQGEKVAIISTSNGWHLVTCRLGSGYVSADYIKGV